MATERAILASGCFWGAQELLRGAPGIISTRTGYSGDDATKDATYRRHGDHAESVEVIFDPDRFTYRELLEFFFQIHDPTTLNRQGNDIGRSYRSAIFFTTPEQERIARETIAEIDASGVWRGRVFVPDRNRTFSGSAEPIDGKTLRAKGCLFGSVLCKTQLWTRLGA